MNDHLVEGELTKGEEGVASPSWKDIRISPHRLEEILAHDTSPDIITITAGKYPTVKSFKAHRSVLASWSSPLSAVLSNNNSHNVLRLPSYSPTTISRLLAFIYTGHCLPPQPSAEDILIASKLCSAAESLQIEELWGYCVDIICSKGRFAGLVREDMVSVLREVYSSARGAQRTDERLVKAVAGRFWEVIEERGTREMLERDTEVFRAVFEGVQKLEKEKEQGAAK